MKLSKIVIKNFRLIIDAELLIDEKTTLIVGRNNTAKTSCLNLIDNILHNKPLSYNDYSIPKRKSLIYAIKKFVEKKITYDKFIEMIDNISIDFHVDYSMDDPNDILGALSPFIIDIEDKVSYALIHVENKIKFDENSLIKLFDSALINKTADTNKICEILIDNYNRIFGIEIYAVNPIDKQDKQVKSYKELSDLFPIYIIPAERDLGENELHTEGSLGKLIENFFKITEEELDPQVSEEIIALRKVVEKANKDIQDKSNKTLSSVVQKTIGFGYPNCEQLQLAVSTKLNINDQIKDRTELAYISESTQETLPNSYNGLGYKNLIKIEFLLAAFAKLIKDNGTASIPLLFIEEPESHMHPQMQNAFAQYYDEYLNKLTLTHIQTLITSHSSHIANSFDFSKIRYAQKTNDGVRYKNLKEFADLNKKNISFIRKYLTISRCDLFFTDKVILVEGASERLLIPDMIEKCDKLKLFDSKEYKLPSQYYSLIEVGGAYAHIFLPFIEFLDIPCLIITDIDSVDNSKKKAFVSKGTTTSNETIKQWVKKVKKISSVSLNDVITLNENEKSIGKCHIEFQTEENNLYGRSLEEAIKNVNRDYFKIKNPVTENDISFNEKSKTDFAFDLLFNNSDYEVPQYIKNGLMWLNNQSVL